MLRDPALISEPRLRALGAKGFVRPSPDGLQVVLGPIADGVAMEMRTAAGTLSSSAPVMTAPLLQASRIDPAPWLAALGGRGNVTAVGAASSRIWLDLADPARVDEAALGVLGVRMLTRPSAGTLQLIIGDAEAIAAGLQPA